MKKKNTRPVLKVGMSLIHGKGLFAEQSISKGQLIGRFEGEPATEDHPHVLWTRCPKHIDWPGMKEPEAGSWWKAIRVTNDLKFANHSSHPNSRIWGVRLFADRDIQKGEEITWHYGSDWDED
ncbi:MAG: SET domain-containing protein-lysine N-methyltransferase [Bdellovibrionaceae bacterium]|nr:SET domain-containing protein-lysine N-methyltransferase [Pseudobdellovibrionaceae bacterium]|tara:strand:+ start:228 stop:596 length:369 start_codon:yes stop_codon:yes gene_type:complete